MSAVIINNPGKRGLFMSRDYRRCEAWYMKLWSFTANALQQCRYGDIGLLEE